MTTKWSVGTGRAIVANRKRYADLEVRRVRSVLATFLRKCAERDISLIGTAIDLEVGEFSVVEYVEELLVHAHKREEFDRLGLSGMWFGDDEGWVRVTKHDDECPSCHDRTLEDSRCVRCGYEDMPF